MVQTKMIKQRSALIEGDINQFLMQIGTVPWTKTTLIDIKMDYHEKDDTYTALIIYNQVAVQKPPQQVPQTTS